MSRSSFVKAMTAEGIPLGEGGYMPIYLQPMYQQQIAFGSKGHPFKSPYYKKELDYLIEGHNYYFETKKEKFKLGIKYNFDDVIVHHIPFAADNEWNGSD